MVAASATPIAQVSVSEQNALIIQGQANDGVRLVGGWERDQVDEDTPNLVTVNGETYALELAAGQEITIRGGDGDDQMYISGYTGGNDTLGGGVGNDVMSGGTGNDAMDGGDGADRLSGDAGNDVITAGAGNDTIIGGSDIFALFHDVADRIELTEVLAEVEGDTFMDDPRDEGSWREIACEDHLPEGERAGYRFTTLVRAD